MTLAIEHHTLPNPRARLLLVHGYAEHRGRYAELVAQLETQRIECHLFDLLGHGESAGPRGHVARFSQYLDDVQRVANEIPRDLPRILLGHSLGGLIALSYVRAHPDDFDALVVSSPFLRAQFHVPRAQLFLGRIASRVLPALRIPNPLRAEWVSRDADVVAKYKSDPHVFRITTPRFFTESAAAQEELFAHADEIRTPALFLLAGSDRIADHKHALELFDRLGSKDKTKHVYADLYHEIFNEPERTTVFRDLRAWLESRFPV